MVVGYYRHYRNSNEIQNNHSADNWNHRAEFSNPCKKSKREKAKRLELARTDCVLIHETNRKLGMQNELAEKDNSDITKSCSTNARKNLLN